MHGYDLFRQVYQALGERERYNNQLYPFRDTTRALNLAQIDLAQEMILSGGGWWWSSAALTPATGATSVMLPSDFLYARRLRDAAADVVLWDRMENKYPRPGVRFAHGSLIWDEPLPAAASWVLEYARRPRTARTGTLDAAGSTTTVILPTKDSAGSVSSVDDEYIGMSYSTIWEPWKSEQEGGDFGVVSTYAGSTRTLTMTEALGRAPRSGDHYLLMEEWPEEWSEALVYGVLVRLPEGREMAGEDYAAAKASAREHSRLARRQGQQPRHTIYHEDA